MKKSIVALALGGLMGIATVNAQTTLFSFTSSAQSWVGQGQSATLTPAGGWGFAASRNMHNGVSLDVTNATEHWHLDFAAPGTGLLTTGSYPDATRYPFEAAISPGMDFYGNGRGNNTLNGSFTVLDINYGPGNAIVSFAASFLMYEEGIAQRWEQGTILFNSRAYDPQISVQPQSQSAVAGDSINLGVTATGQPPLRYQWRFNGTSIPGATGTNYVVLSASPGDAGNYSVVVTNGYGSAISSNATVTIIGAVPLPEALDLPGWTWTTGGNASWFGQTNASHDGLDAAKSGNIFHNQNSWFETTITDGPGILTFWWKVSSETNADFLSLSVNGVVQTNRISGEVDWRKQACRIQSGTNVVRWCYSKNATNTVGQDKAWVDEVTFVQTNNPPVWTSAGPTNASLGQLYTYHLQAMDPDDDPVTFTGTVVPPWLRLLCVESMQNCGGSMESGASQHLRSAQTISGPVGEPQYAGLPTASRITVNPLASQFPELTLFVSVLDNAGHSITGLPQTAFTVREQSTNDPSPVTENITCFQEAAGPSSISFSLVFDVSGSMDWDLDDAKVAAISFLTNCTSADRGNLVEFASQDEVSVAFASDWVNTDKNGDGTPDIIEAINGLETMGATALYDGTALGIQTLSQEPAPKAVILFTDGGENDSVLYTNVTQIINKARNEGVPLYTIGLGSGAETNDLVSMAEQTGGRFYAAPSAEEMGAVYRAISEEVRSSYVLRYISHNPNYDGTFRSVTVSAAGASGAGTYRVNHTPVVALHTNTLALSTNAPAAGTPLTIKGTILDLDAQRLGQTVSATLYYRHASETNYTNVAMIVSLPTNSIYQFDATIAAANVRAPGLFYYVRVSDGIQEVQVPFNHGSTPMAIAVQGNHNPVITHTPVAAAPPGYPAVIRALVRDNDAGDRISQAMLFYRTHNQRQNTPYNSTKMERVGTNYVGFIPADKVTAAGVDYYICGWDLNGLRGDSTRPFQPHLIDTTGCWLVGIPGLSNVGNHPVTLEANDRYSASVQQFNVAAVLDVPFITTQPADQEAVVGSSATFSISTVGPEPLAYQWRFEGEDIAGATNTSYVVNNVTTNSVGQYSVLVSNAFGLELSLKAMLTVHVPPSIANQPTNQAVDVDDSVFLTIDAGGDLPLYYQWLKNGGAIAGGTGSAYGISNAQPADAGTYSVVITNRYGSISSGNLVLTVRPPIPLDEALDASMLVWNTGGDRGWIGQSLVTHDGVDGARSGKILDYEESWVETTITEGPGTLTFFWKVSSENNYDWLKFEAICDTLLQSNRISGEVDWQPQTYRIDTGTALLRWRYSKDGSVDGGEDRAWLDQVVFTPDPILPPSIVAQPASATNDLGTTATFSVNISGTRPFAYQWRKDGTNLVNGSRISGATGSAITINDLMLSDAGGYSVVVTNRGGSVTSSVANLTVNVPLHHFAWNIGASPKPANMPFAVTIQAQNFFNQPFTNFSGTVALSAKADGNLVTNTILPLIGHTQQGVSGNYTVGYSFTPSTNLLVTHVRHYFGEKVSIWTDTGALIASQTVESVPGTWVETPLTAPVQLNGGTRYRLGVCAGYGDYYYRTDQSTNFAQGRIHRACYAMTDNFPSTDDTTGVRWYLVDLRYRAYGFGEVSMSPPLSGNFVNGVWSGNVAIPSPGTNVFLEADDGVGHLGDSALFQVQWQNSPPILSLQPTDQTVYAGQNAAFDASAWGTMPLNYQWRLNGTDVPGATASSLALSGVTTANAGTYSIVVTNAYGSAISSNAILTVLAPLSLPEALDTPTWAWQTGGDAAWIGQTNTTHDGTDAAESLPIGAGQATWIETTLTNGPGDLTFWWKVSSATNAHFLELYTNNVLVTQISGTTDWSQQTFTIGRGTQTIRWQYRKDATPAAGLDRAWVDGVNYLQATAPVVTVQPQTRYVKPGTNVTFSVSTIGTQPLYFQWRKNGTNLTNGGRISGVASATLSIANAAVSDAAQYSVLVTNFVGSTTSSNASLVLVPSLHHFTWSSIPSPQYVGIPFPVTIVALDSTNNTVSSFAGALAFNATTVSGTAETNILGNAAHNNFANGLFTLGYAFTPNANLTVTHVRHYCGDKVSIWTDGGTLLASQTVMSVPGTWVETPLASPLQLTNGIKYRVGIYIYYADAYYGAGMGTTFPHGTINSSCYAMVDGFPNYTDSRRWWFVDLRYTAAATVPVAMRASGSFVSGVFNGFITFDGPATNITLSADDGLGDRGQANLFSVLEAARLNLAPTNNALRIAWPVSTLNYSLESCSDLTARNWATVTNVPATENGEKTVTLPVLGNERYYRLRQLP